MPPLTLVRMLKKGFDDRVRMRRCHVMTRPAVVIHRQVDNGAGARRRRASFRLSRTWVTFEANARLDSTGVSIASRSHESVTVRNTQFAWTRQEKSRSQSIQVTVALYGLVTPDAVYPRVVTRRRAHVQALTPPRDRRSWKVAKKCCSKIAVLPAIHQEQYWASGRNGPAAVSSACFLRNLSVHNHPLTRDFIPEQLCTLTATLSPHHEPRYRFGHPRRPSEQKNLAVAILNDANGRQRELFLPRYCFDAFGCTCASTRSLL